MPRFSGIPVEDGPKRPRFSGVPVDAPAEMPVPESQVSQDARAQMSAMTQHPAKAQYDALPEWQKPIVAASDAVQLAGSGAMMGFGEKAAAAVRAPFTDKTYDQELEQQRMLTEAARQRAGSAALPAELVGAIGTPLAVAKKGVTLAGKFGADALKGGRGLLARSGLMSAEGAGYGATTAAGNDQNIGTGAVVGGLGGAGGNVLAEALAAGVGKAASAFNKKSPTPSAADLRAAKTAAYKHVDDSGATYSPAAMNDLIAGIGDDVRAASINPMRHPKAASMVQDIEALAGESPTLTQLDQLRQVVRRDVVDSGDDAEAHFGKIIIKNIDEFIGSAKTPQMAQGSADEAAAAIGNARDANSRFRKTEAVNEAVDSAHLRAGSTGSGGNVDNATRQNLRRVLEHTPNLTPAEREAMTKAIMGSKGQNVLRTVGKMSPQGNGLMTALGVGGAMANPLLGVPALVGVGAKSIADRATKANVAALLKVIGDGGKRLPAAESAVQRFAKAKRDALSRALMGANAHMAGAP